MRLAKLPSRRQFLYSLVLLGLTALGGSGCATRRFSTYVPPAPVGEAGTLFICDGAGDFRGCSTHFRELIENDGLPLRIEVVPWSHGYLRVVADQVQYEYARARGVELADRLLRFRAEHPEQPIHLVGHSAGATVALAALENLPPEVVDRVLLLAPSLSVGYDLVPALRSVRLGMHVYHSRRDSIYLGLGTGIVGNSDRARGPSGGRYGFNLRPAADPAAAGKLHQQEWTPADTALRHDGKHYGAYQPDYVRAYMIPLLLSPAR